MRSSSWRANTTVSSEKINTSIVDSSGIISLFWTFMEGRILKLGLSGTQNL